VSVILLITVIVVGIVLAKNNRVRTKEDKSMDCFIQMSVKQWNEFVYSDLFRKALGDYNWDTLEWTPLTDKMYAFDAEVYDIENMYTLCLQGIQSIVKDIEITDVREDLSGVTDEMTQADDPFSPMTDGIRSVSFKCNGHEYSVTMTSYGDWINAEFFVFMNQVLEKENCPKRLWLLGDGLDQMAAVIYDSSDNARKYAN
jgi:hypothetical protein